MPDDRGVGLIKVVRALSKSHLSFSEAVTRISVAHSVVKPGK